MQIAKLSTDQIVQVLKPAQTVRFSRRLHVLVCDRLTIRRGRQDPYWMPAAAVVWQIDFADKIEDGSTFAGNPSTDR